MVKIGLIGCGYWGPNLLRNFLDCPDCEVKLVSELDDSRIEYLNQKFPQVGTTKDYKDLLNGDIDAVVLASPALTHYALAKEAMEAGKHVLVEKPLAMSTKEAKELVAMAKKKKLKLMAGHTFEYNAAVRELKSQIKKGTIGNPYYLYSQRLNFGIVRQDINALWNLAPHDVSILIYVLDEMPTFVSCRGYDFIQKGIADVIFMVLYFPKDVVAHVQVSWLDPGKVRKLTVVGSEKMIIYDDMDNSKIKIFDKGIKKKNIADSLGRYDDFGKYQLIKTAGDVSFPHIEMAEPLKEECAHFIDCIKNNKTPLTDGKNGLRVVKVLEAAQKSMDNNGKNIKL